MVSQIVPLGPEDTEMKLHCTSHGKIPKFSHQLCAPCSGFEFTAGLPVPLVSSASFLTRLSKFDTKCFSKPGDENQTVSIVSIGWAFKNLLSQNRN